MSPKIDAPYLWIQQLDLVPLNKAYGLDHHGPSIHSGHRTASINCCNKNILLQRSHNHGVWNYWQQKTLYCICYTIWIDWHMILEFDQEDGSLVAPMALASSPSHWQQVEEQAPKPVGWMMCFLLMTFVPVQKLCVNKYIYIYALLYEFCFLWFTNCVLLSDYNSWIPGCLSLLAFHFKNTLILGIWCSTIPHFPGCFCPWTFFQNIGFNMVPSDPFMSHRATQLGYSAGEFQALQLIVLVMFGVVN